MSRVLSLRRSASHQHARHSRSRRQVPSPAPKPDTNFDTLRISIGVRFLFAKTLIYKAFSILFNDIRLCGTPETVAAEPFSFSPITPFDERSRGVHFRQKGCAHFNYSSRAQTKGRKIRSPKNANDLATLYLILRP